MIYFSMRDEVGCGWVLTIVKEKIKALGPQVEKQKTKRHGKYSNIQKEKMLERQKQRQ